MEPLDEKTKDNVIQEFRTRQPELGNLFYYFKGLYIGAGVSMDDEDSLKIQALTYLMCDVLGNHTTYDPGKLFDKAINDIELAEYIASLLNEAIEE